MLPFKVPASISDRINPIGLIALCLLVIQTTAAVVVTRYSKTRHSPTTIPYNNSSLVVTTEIVKFVSSLILVFLFDTSSAKTGVVADTVSSPAEEGTVGRKPTIDATVSSSNSSISFSERFSRFKTILKEENFTNIPGTLKLAVPAALYTIQNNVIYTALNNLDATVFQVGYQSKVVTTAILSVLLLKRTLTLEKWISLFVLAFGIVLTQLQSASSPPVSSSSPVTKDNGALASAVVVPTSSTASSSSASAVENNNNFFLGMVAVLVASACSALAGVYFEKILKGSAPSVWVRNAQLSFFSIIIGMVGYFGTVVVVAEEGAASPIMYPFYALAVFFDGYDSVVISIVMIQAVGGLIIACVVKYADNILKGFATALSIVACGAISAMYMGFVPSSTFVGGSCVVILATMMYASNFRLFNRG